MQCPRCFKTDVSLISDDRYVCNNPDCVDDEGKRTQFYIIYDEKIEFPYNQIFANREKRLFYKKPYWKVKDPGEIHV